MSELIVLIRARVEQVGWSKAARLAGIDRCNLHRSLGPRSAQFPASLRTLQKLLPVLGLELTVKEINRCSQE